MKHNIFLFAMLFLAISNINSLYSIELDTVWVSDEYGQILFQHPVSKNILIAKNGITEIDSKTGKFVRSFPIEIEGIDMSPDGSKFLYSFSENIYIFDYNASNSIEQIDFVTYGKFLTNEEIVFRNRKATSNIIKYNLITKIKQEIIPDNSVTTLSTSPDGKYISYATYEKNNTTDSKAYLYLMDAETMKVIKQLGSWESGGQQIEDITFSPNSKYLTYNLFLTGKTDVNIYELENKTIFKSINLTNFQYPISGFNFLGNDYYIQYGIRNSKKNYELGIYKMNTQELIYKINDYESFFFSPLFDSKLSYLFYNNLSFSTICVDLNNIISGIPPTNPINIRYNNKTLIINNNNKPIINITINTIEGREIYKQNFEQVSFQNQIEIPIELTNGLYFINITSGSDNFVHKLLIKE